MATRALCTFGCWRGSAEREQSVLTTANEFRAALCRLYWDRHCELTDWRNSAFPRLWAALGEYETAKFAEWWAEKQIKLHHVDAGDRNAVTPALTAQLAQCRERRKAAKAAVDAERKSHADTLAVFHCWWQTLRDWKNCKDLAKRKAAYAAIEWPRDAHAYQAAVDARNAERAAKAHAAGKDQPAAWQPTVNVDAIAEYGRLWMAHDLAERDLYREFAPRLHPMIRAEIVEASQPKLSKTAPGIRYRYHRPPKPRPWEKLSVQFVGGITFDELLSGESTAVRLEEFRRNGRGVVFYRVQQQIGTAKSPCLAEYVLIADRPFPPDAVIQRWSLRVNNTGGQYPKREVVPIIKTSESKPIGSAVFAYRLSWTVRKEGIEVCRFWGEHVNERLVLPNRLLALRMATRDAQAATDAAANALLVERGVPPKAGQKQGVEALAVYCHDHPLDNGAANLLDVSRAKLRRAARVTQRAIRCIVKIYETVTRRVCSRHATLHRHVIDLRQIKRYDTRDLLREDVLSQKSRELLFAAAPGKLKALLDGYGLASSDVPVPEPEDARGTDLFTSYVQTIRGRWRSDRKGKQVRSRTAALVAVAQ